METINVVTNLEKALPDISNENANGKIDLKLKDNVKPMFKALMNDFQELTFQMKQLFDANTDEFEATKADVARIKQSCTKIEHLAKLIEKHI